MRKPNPSPGTETAPPGRLRAGAAPPAAGRWQAAEGRLYPLVMADAARYEAAVTLVGEVAGVLRAQCGTVTELADADTAAVLARCPSASVVSALGLDPGTVYDAACATRWRELNAPQMDAAAGAGQGDPR
jgi:hypothetical protein